MKSTSYLALAAVLFVLAFTMGCGEKKVESTGAGEGYTITVNPTSAIPGGVVTIDLRISNPFENLMKNTKVDVLSTGIPSDYTVNGDSEDIGAFEVGKGQQYPVIMTIDVPPDAPSGTISPSAEVCFDYRTNFYYDSALKPRVDAAKEVTLSKAVENGPIGISVVGLDSVYYENGQATGVMTISNSWKGKIKSVNEVFLSTGDNTKISSLGLQYSTCSGGRAITGNAISVIDDVEVTKTQVNMVMEKAKVNEETALIALEKSGGDVDAAIKSLTTTTTTTTTTTSSTAKTAIIKKTSGTSSSCYILQNTNAISSGLSPKIIYKFGTSSEISIERLKGYVDVTYCYPVPFGTISITAVK